MQEISGGLLRKCELGPPIAVPSASGSARGWGLEAVEKLLPLPGWDGIKLYAELCSRLLAWCWGGPGRESSPV